MSWWSTVVYGIAALWGVRILLAMMVQHRRIRLDELIQTELARREAEAPPEPEPQSTATRKAA